MSIVITWQSSRSLSLGQVRDVGEALRRTADEIAGRNHRIVAVAYEADKKPEEIVFGLPVGLLPADSLAAVRNRRALIDGMSPDIKQWTDDDFMRCRHIDMAVIDGDKILRGMIEFAQSNPACVSFRGQDAAHVAVRASLRMPKLLLRFARG